MIDGVLVGLVVAALATIALQAGDAVAAAVDAAALRDSDEPDAVTRRHGRELFWAFAFTAVLAVLVAYGVERAAHAAGLAGVAVLLVTAAGAFVVGCVGAVAVLRRERPTYARLRRDLRDRSTFAVDADELRDFEARLERADRVRARRPRAAIVLRALGLVLVATTATLVILDDAALLAPVIVAVLVDIAALVVALRASSLRRERLEAVLEAQRAEVVALLERARIPSRGSVPGLRDRVARALAILREKQR